MVGHQAEAFKRMIMFILQKFKLDYTEIQTKGLMGGLGVADYTGTVTPFAP
jgi:hypothetical protein